jgi:hypothetical protein
MSTVDGGASPAGVAMHAAASTGVVNVCAGMTLN